MFEGKHATPHDKRLGSLEARLPGRFGTQKIGQVPTCHCCHAILWRLSTSALRPHRPWQIRW